MKESYEEKVEAFNRASGARYIAEVHFLTFRKTRKGIKVGYTLAKTHEIHALREAVENAGTPYYMI